MAPAPTPGSFLLDVQDLRVALPFPGGDLVEDVRGVSFRVPAGGFHALVGESGCGKSVSAMALTRLPPADGRLLRRLVRDNQFRKMSPLQTFEMWPKVLAGERKWIDPFKGNADAFFDSGLVYELSVIKSYAAGLLEMVKIKRPDEAKAGILSALLAAVLPADPAKVPGDSILRETIGGSLLEY